MKKTLKIFVIVMLLFSCVACKEEPQATEASFVLPLDKLRAETTTAELEYVWVEPELPTVVGDMPNSVGILINNIFQPETTTREVPEEDRGIKAADNTKFPAEEDAKRLGVSKILTFYTSSSRVYDVDEDIVSKFNELLVTKYGCDFVVSIYGGRVGNNAIGYDYYQAVTDARSRGQQTDILIASEPAYYSRLVDENYFVDITETLATTEAGKKLYEAYPEEVWKKVELDGKIYGYMPESSPASSYVLTCNKELAERLGLDVKEGFTFYEIGDTLEKANFSKAGIGGAMPIYANWKSLYNMLGYYDMGNGVFAKKDAEGNWVAFNPTEDEEFVKLCKTVREYIDKGWLINVYSAEKTMMGGDFLFALTACEGADIDIENSKVCYKYGTESAVYDVIFGEMYHSYYEAGENTVYGITTWSQYKEEALKLMMLLSTEEELVNLLTYGIENEHYTYVDDKRMKLYSSEGYGIDEGVVNPNLLYSQNLEPEDKIEFYKEWSKNYEPSPFAEYDISLYDYEQLVERYDEDTFLYQLYYEGCVRLLLGGFEDVDEAIAEVNRMQKEAGIDEFIAAINKMLKNAEIQGRLVDE